MEVAAEAAAEADLKNKSRCQRSNSPLTGEVGNRYVQCIKTGYSKETERVK